MRIRQSMLGQFDACPRRVQYDLESPDVYHSGIIRAIGTAYHAGMEFFYLTRQMFQRNERGQDALLQDCQAMAMSSLHEEIIRAGDAFIWDDKYPDMDSASKVVEFMLTTYITGGHAWPSDWTVLGVEHRFELQFGQHVRTGTMDLVLQDPNGWIYGVDHKTAGRMWDQYKHLPRKNSQSSFYVAALRELYPDAPGHRFCFDIMTYAGKFERRISDPTPAHCQAVLDKALQVATLVEGMQSAGIDLPANPASTLCSPKFCDYWLTCPHGAVLDA